MNTNLVVLLSTNKHFVGRKLNLKKQLSKVSEKLSDSRSRSGSVASKSTLTKQKPLSSSDSESDSEPKCKITRRSRLSTQMIRPIHIMIVQLTLGTT